MGNRFTIVKKNVQFLGIFLEKNFFTRFLGGIRLNLLFSWIMYLLTRRSNPLFGKIL